MKMVEATTKNVAITVLDDGVMNRTFRLQKPIVGVPNATLHMNAIGTSKVKKTPMDG